MRVVFAIGCLSAVVAAGYCGDVHAVLCSGIQQPICTFPGDDIGFMHAAGQLRTIDFESLPNGSPSVNGTPITPSFNYTSQGVTFSPSEGSMYIIGTGLPPPDSHGLAADAPVGVINAVVADLVVPTSAVGIYAAGTLDLYDASGSRFLEMTYFDQAFLGVVSDIPISRAVLTQGIEGVIIDSFVFNPTPEPASFSLLAFLGLVFHRRCSTRLLSPVI
jgi:hypothetical protein